MMKNILHITEERKTRSLINSICLVKRKEYEPLT